LKREALISSLTHGLTNCKKYSRVHHSSLGKVLSIVYYRL